MNDNNKIWFGEQSLHLPTPGILVALFKKSARLLSPKRPTTLQAAATMNDWLIYNFADIGRHIFGL